MIWSRLKNLKCPECNAPLLQTAIGFNCCACSFKIRTQKFNEIVSDLYKPKNMREDPERNLAELNNL